MQRLDDRDIYMEYFLADGFLVPKLTIERPLYRYRTNIDFIVDEIENDHVYLSPIDALNDPFDSSFATTVDEAIVKVETLGYYLSRCYFLHSEKYFDAVKANLSSCLDDELSLGDFANLVAAEIKKHGGHYPASAIANNYCKFSLPYVPKRINCGNVTCFSETWESVPMWSYYADSHRGVCMKYDFNLLDREKQSHRNILTSLQKVWYSQYRPFDKDGEFSPFIKGLQWAHEQEWRLFRQFGSKFVVLPCLTELYLGINFDFANIDRIMDAVKKSPRKIAVFVLRPHPDTYEFLKMPLNYE